MPKITIIEAAELTGKSKRTIQRYISAGKLSYIDRPDGTRLLDEGEVVAVFGIPKSSVTTVTHDASQDVTQQQMTALMQGLQQAIIEAQAPLLAQIAALTTQVGELTNRLEHKPEPAAQEVKSSGRALAAKAVEAAISTSVPSPTKKSSGTRQTPLVDSDGYLEIPVFGRS